MSSPYIDQAQKNIRAAVEPLDCRFTVAPYEEYLEFQILSPQGKALGPLTRVTATHLRERSSLLAIIISALDRLQQDGYQLDPWSML